MFKDLVNLIDTNSPLAWVVGTILAIYLSVKIVKDVYTWIKSAVERKNKDLTDSLAKFQYQDSRISALELEFKVIREDLNEIKTMLKLRPGLYDGK